MSYYFGVDYYPEHWPRERWDTDAKLMNELGIDVVRMGEFSWVKFEPQDGSFSFEWLDDAIELLSQYGIKTVIGTPTAAPPAWLIRQYPEILPVDSKGLRTSFGGRHHDCQSNEIYRGYVRRLVTEIAKHYAENENVIGFQIDNELGNSHGDLCMCDSCADHFRSWLKNKYGNIEELCEKWGTAFWSQGYTCFDEIEPPRATVAGKNPSQELDWKRFCSDLIVDFAKQQIDILKEYAPNKFVTHNYMGFADKVDYFDLSKQLDFIGHDQYPGHIETNQAQPFENKTSQAQPFENSAALDLMRGVNNQKGFWIIEQQSGITGWGTMSCSPKPGQLKLWTTQSIAHGADTILYFRFRSCTVGTEQYWHGIIPHNGVPARSFYEIKDTINNLKPLLKKLQGGTPKAEVAILYSYDWDYAFQIQPHHPKLNYIEQVKKYYKGLYDEKIVTDFISAEQDFNKYKLILAPLAYIATPELADKLTQYVNRGGALLLTMRSGVKDINNICQAQAALPGLFQKLCGLSVTEYDCLRNEDVSICQNDVCVGHGSKWSDVLTLDSAVSLAQYGSGYMKDEACFAKNVYGNGTVYYVGTEPDEAFMNIITKQLKNDLSLYSNLTVSQEAEIITRSTDEGDYMFIMNHLDRDISVNPPQDQELIVGTNGDVLEKYGIRVYFKKK